MSLVERAAAGLVELLGADREGLTFMGKTFDLRTHELGSVHLPSGLLVACDPIVGAGDATPFARPVPAGSHRVRALVAQYEHNGDQRVAAAVVELGAAPAVTWEASSPPAGDDDFDGYPVDSGTGCFASPEAVQRLAGLLDEHGDPLSTALEQTYVPTWDWANFDVGDGLNVVAFHSGFGDGLFPTTFGLDAGGAPVVAVTDFFVFDATAL